MIRSFKRLHCSRLLQALCSTYILGVLGFFLLRARLTPWPPFLALLNSFTPFLFAPLALVLPLALVRRAKLTLFGSLVVLVMFARLYAPFFLPRLDAARDPSAAPLTLMTFNVLYNNTHPQQFVAAIADEGADVVAVQELVPTTAELLRAELSGHYPHMVLRTDIGLLSRYPILESEWFYPAGDGKAALHAQIDLDGTRVHVLILHPPPPGLRWFKDTPLPVGLDERAQQRQIAAVAGRIAALEGPVLLLGDLNTSDQSRAYARLSGVLRDAYREAGWGFGFTFPQSLRLGPLSLPGPFLRLDYIFHSTDFYARWARVGCRGGSDHCYLVAQLAHPSPLKAEYGSQKEVFTTHLGQLARILRQSPGASSPNHLVE